ncbi:hypothetical protein LCGC14_3154900, partial [marine sediment metagenome]
VRVNALGPGFMATEATLDRSDWKEGRDEEVLSRTPLRRIGDPDELRTLGSFLVQRHKDPAPNAIRVTIHGRTNWPTDTILKQVLSRKISDRVTIASTRLGFNQDFYIEKTIHDYKLFEGRFNLDVTWICSRASEQDEQTWLLETAGFGELGETTYLSY